MLHFLSKAGAVLEERGATFPSLSTTEVYITQDGPKITNPFQIEGFFQTLLKVRQRLKFQCYRSSPRRNSTG